MVQLSAVFFGLVASSVYAHPVLEKRIAQVITQSTAEWEKACLAAGGGQDCNPISVASFSTLLAGAGPCEQQDAADRMVDLAKKLNSTQMINLARIFAQQPRNSPASVSIPYCQKAPKNSELRGLFQCQFNGVNKQVFAGQLQLGAAGTIPFERQQPVNPLGSCPAHPNGPVPDGQQLVDIVQAPPSDNPGSQDAPTTKTPKAAIAPSAQTPKSAPPASGEAADGKAAQELNAKFATLTPDSPCNVAELACVEGAFAQCVSGKFVSTPCAPGTTCAALPLVKLSGAVITCTTEADAIARIQATGASGGLTG